MEKSIVRNNLMNDKDYSPYCGNPELYNCKEMPRTKWNTKLNQFVCPNCGWTSRFPESFIKQYKEKWNK